ncbi:hypothetical protein TVAG_189170 [Trichomonas vaginalis G3]|uniref:Uncharacterized protein n=1 Tax=Trichomonas vaginalis (strain ATCC PRA-98 / G3) TaxID=412133 RepID=A2F337_TRIV3|nr:protein ubiquitination [Trichomonas vaginalis G3]EAY00701.1 hypothetical protein TVAG_189170 [Trichomonas vaginalis G3]KAI5513271.1 protein ubiquitination [Trichomonas vaginalis G3]|eukprot:XP_001313630.1 hypothetical protein [Trichomonas vaginalis G3]
MFSISLDDTVKRFAEFLELDDIMSFLTLDELCGSISRINFNNQLATKFVSKVFDECTKIEKNKLLSLMKFSPGDDATQNFKLFELILTSLEIPILNTLFQSIKTQFNTKKQEPSQPPSVKSEKKTPSSVRSKEPLQSSDYELCLLVGIGDEADLRKYIDSHTDINFYCETDKKLTPMMIACRFGHLNIVKLLCSYGVDINRPNSDGYIPLISVIQGDNLEIIKYLYTINLKIPENINENKLVNIAAIYNSLRVMQYFVDEWYMTVDYECCLYAARHSNEIMLNYLWNKFPEMQETKKECCIVAAHYGNVKAINFFYDSKYVDINATDSKGRTTLMEAIRANQIETAKLIIDKNCDVNIKSVKNKDALFYAARNGDVNFLEYLIMKGAIIDDINKLIKVAEKADKSKMVTFFKLQNDYAKNYQ